MIPKLTASLDFHGQALLLRAERQRLIAGNIANADTPGFKARDFDFASALRAASAGATGAIGDGVANAPGEGIAQGVMQAGGRPAPLLRYALPAQTNLDSNSVDMDRERAAFAQNATQYEASLRFINGSVRTVLDAMKSHHQG
ncbi:MAG: flagellar basal body rod protein FlgB [Rubrivivax sp.]|nr:flagellar basal body rod protein FlgB [Rubrivivax sp.]